MHKDCGQHRLRRSGGSCLPSKAGLVTVKVLSCQFSSRELPQGSLGALQLLLDARDTLRSRIDAVKPVELLLQAIVLDHEVMRKLPMHLVVVPLQCPRSELPSATRFLIPPRSRQRTQLTRLL